MTHQHSISVDLNCDFGEGFGAYSFGQDDELLRYVSSVNIACGFHAGDPHTMRESVRKAASAGVAIGAHPGFPDRLGFGRRSMAMTAEEVYDIVLYQLGALKVFAHAEGVGMRHVKPHGALYHMANQDAAISAAIVRATCDCDNKLMVYGQSGSILLAEASKAGLTSVSETFADRAYEPDGSLASRNKPRAIIHDADQAARQAVAMAVRGTAFTLEGLETPVRADTICLHGDGAHAALFASRIREALESEGVAIRPPVEARQ
ncbi:LamB/YcsF family protein [Paenibacillus sp. NPDC058071]|uniref:LamB/YcsF family protein n=1 Tax=Paenibacillus sp. NPDC058071 TaxID=3346326 RepID=UPI0036DD2ECB